MLDIYFETYGCTANYNSTEILKGLIKESGLNISSNSKNADFIIINSCIVKQPTQEKIRRRIQDLSRENKKIIITGCMPRIFKKNFQKEKNIYLLDTSQIKNITNLIKDIQTNQYNSEKYLKNRDEIKLNLPKIPKEKTIGINQISEGCLGNCTYCITRLAKGELFSYPQKDIIKSIKSNLNAGCKEIWITSQDNASYGNDYNEYILPKLLKNIININKKFYLRIGMMNPNNVLKILSELIEIYKNKKVFKFIHIPVQSGSNKILKNMNRKYTKQEFLKIINKLKENFPEMHISTDVIIGYPGETEKDFNETYELIRKIQPETLNISRFWPRPNTKAEKLKPVNNKIIKKRIIKISQLHKEILLKKQEQYNGKKAKVIINQKGISGFPNTYMGRDINYKLYAIQSNEKILGKELNIQVTKPTAHYLISKEIESATK